MARHEPAGRIARRSWHTRESDPGRARGGPTYRAILLRSANRRCAPQPDGCPLKFFINEHMNGLIRHGVTKAPHFAPDGPRKARTGHAPSRRNAAPPGAATRARARLRHVRIKCVARVCERTVSREREAPWPCGCQPGRHGQTRGCRPVGASRPGGLTGTERQPLLASAPER